MAKKRNRLSSTPVDLPKSPTGITGLDEITGGGLPKGRPTLITGSAGCGKTMMAMEFLVRGATEYNEPGVFMAFEESAEELTKNVASMGFDLARLQAAKKMVIDYVHIDRQEIQDTGEYDLEGLFVRLGYAIDSIGAKRVVLDTIEALFAGLPNEAILRAELRRLFRWLKKRGVTAVITGERGDKTLTRYGLEEYVADCVILLDFRILEQIATRRLRIVKYRGSAHGVDEFPFLIGRTGISILPVTSLNLEHAVSSARVSTGISRLDTMLEGKGYYRGSTVLISGSAGTGKTSFAAAFIADACRRRERCLYFAFEESPGQIVRNMNSIGIDLTEPVKKGFLQFHASRPSAYGLEMHLINMHRIIDEYKPRCVVLDPVSNLISVGTRVEVKSVLTRLFDYLKMNGVTVVLTDLSHGGTLTESTNEEISSLIDTWLLLKAIEISGERNRGLYVLKARGMNHSNQIREVKLSSRGIDLVDVYLGEGNVLTGSARLQQEALEKTKIMASETERRRRQQQIERKKKVMQAKIEALKAEYEAELSELASYHAEEAEEEKTRADVRSRIAHLRKADKS